MHEHEKKSMASGCRVAKNTGNAGLPRGRRALGFLAGRQTAPLLGWEKSREGACSLFGRILVAEATGICS